ncbi:hypothetical protein [Pseudomonas phage vB_PsaM_M1]|nr:hypothetical protein [Pseudomonas phage vB_PsaM_M1]
MNLIKRFYNYCFGDYWNTCYNATLVEYYCVLLAWVPLAFNS